MERHYLIDVKLKRFEIDSFDNYPFCLNGVKSLLPLRMHPAVTFFMDENGSAKSTLLEAIAVAAEFNPGGGAKNFTCGRQHGD